MTALATRVDSIELFDRLAVLMTANTERYERLGDISIHLALVMRRRHREPFRVGLRFEGITCTGVTELAAGEEAHGDCWLDGELPDWEAMFDNIAEHGHATGGWTLNTLTVFGDRIRLRATDPMGEDRFHRFNQTLQEFVDGAASVTAGKE